MAAQSIAEDGDDFKTSSRTWSSEASQKVLLRPGLVSANGGLWNTPYGQLRFVILLVFKGILVRLIPWAHGARKRPKARARITLFIEGLARMVT